MSSRKTTKDKLFSKTALSYYCVALVFLLLGVLAKRVPYVTLDAELNIGDFATGLIAIIGLVGAWYFIPAVIEKAVQQRHSKDMILVGDIEEVCKALTALRDKYQSLYSQDTDITDKVRGEILQEVTIIGNLISDLSIEMKTEHSELEFETKVKNYYNEKTYKAITEDLPINAAMTKEYMLTATKSITLLSSRLKKYRFETFK